MSAPKEPNIIEFPQKQTKSEPSPSRDVRDAVDNGWIERTDDGFLMRGERFQMCDVEEAERFRRHIGFGPHEVDLHILAYLIRRVRTWCDTGIAIVRDYDETEP